MLEEAELDAVLDEASSFPEFRQIEADCLLALQAARPVFDLEQALQAKVFGRALQVLLALGLVWLFGGAIVTFSLLESLPVGLDVPVPRKAALGLLALGGLALGLASIVLVRQRRKQGLTGPIAVNLNRSLDEMIAFQSTAHWRLADMQNVLLSAAREATVAVQTLDARLGMLLSDHVKEDVKRAGFEIGATPTQLPTAELQENAERTRRRLTDSTRVQAAGARIEGAARKVRSVAQSMMSELERHSAESEAQFTSFLAQGERDWFEGVTEKDRLIQGASSISNALDHACSRGFEIIFVVSLGGQAEFLKNTTVEIQRVSSLRKTRVRMLNGAGLIAGWLPVLVGLVTLVYLGAMS